MDELDASRIAQVKAVSNALAVSAAPLASVALFPDVFPPTTRSCDDELAPHAPLATCRPVAASDEVDVSAPEADDLTAYDVPASTEAAVSPAVPEIDGITPAIADRIELLAVSKAADTTVTAPLADRIDGAPARLPAAADSCAPLVVSTAVALTETLPGDTSCALVVNAESTVSAADACTTLRPLADAANTEAAESAVEPKVIRPAVLVSAAKAVSGDTAKVTSVPVVVSTAPAARLAVPVETPIPTGVSVDSVARLADARLVL